MTNTGAVVLPTATVGVAEVTALTSHVAWLNAVAARNATACPVYPSAIVAAPPLVLSVIPSIDTPVITALSGISNGAPAASFRLIALAAPPNTAKS